MTDDPIAARPPRPVQAVERVRGVRPEDESWRADALAGSRHSRWLDELRRPLEVYDLHRAREICARVARHALRDYAPALLLLPEPSRRRLQALTAYALTLFDFARQTGLEGERLTAINRCEFDLENALTGEPPGQPVFVLIADLQRSQSWPRPGFERLHGCARRRSTVARPVDRHSAENEALALGSALAWLLLGHEPDPAVAELAAVLVRLRALTDIGDDLRRHCCRLPVSEVTDVWHGGGVGTDDEIAAAILAEVERLRPLLERSTTPVPTSDRLAPALGFCRGASRSLLDQIALAGAGVVDEPPSLGLGARLWLLVRSRWLQ